MYARSKATHPYAHRIENLTWRMMALALKKKKEEEAKSPTNGVCEPRDVQDVKPIEPNPPQRTPRESEPDQNGKGERGRRIDKGKAKVSVIGFDGQNPDNVDDSE
jgi:GATA-binding protein